MAYTTINKSSEYFNTKLYAGTGATQSITGVNFQPDLVWIKNRQDTYNNHLFDVIRGVEKEIRTDDTTAVSSATSDESGLGIFEYTVPSGYYALCTKNINEQEYD